MTAVEDEATGSVTFTTNATANAVQEGATVTADASGLSDVDGTGIVTGTTFSGLLRMIHQRQMCGY